MDVSKLNESECGVDVVLPDYSQVFHINQSYYRSPTIFKKFMPIDYVKIALYVVTIAITLLGNISILITVASNKHMQSSLHYYIANLAVTGILICCFCMCTQLVNTMTDPIFALGMFMCKLNPFIQMACLTSSILTISVICCNRSLAMLFPFQARVIKQPTSIVLYIIWIISLTVSFPFLIVKRYVRFQYREDFLELRCNEIWPKGTYWHNGISQCLKYPKYQVSYYFTVTITLYFIPMIIMLTAYLPVIVKMFLYRLPGERHENNVNIHNQFRRKIIKMVFFILVTFIICWTPLQIYILILLGENLKVYSGSTPPPAGYIINKDSWKEHLKWCMYFLAYVNNCINLFIYGRYFKAYRDSFLNLMKCACGRLLSKSRSQVENGVDNSRTPIKIGRLFRRISSSVISLRNRTKNFYSSTKRSSTVPTAMETLDASIT